MLLHWRLACCCHAATQRLASYLTLPLWEIRAPPKPGNFPLGTCHLPKGVLQFESAVLDDMLLNAG